MSTLPNPCNVCVHRHDADQQAGYKWHCALFKEEPKPCHRIHFKLDEWAFMQDVLRQALRATEPQEK